MERLMSALSALGSLGGLASSIFGNRAEAEERKRQEEEARKKRAIEIANYMGDAFGESHGGIRSWL